MTTTNPAPLGRPRVDNDISDLFFNTDISHCVINDERGQFVKYNEAEIACEAEVFLNSLYRLGIRVPSAADLIADFYARL